MKWNFQSAPLRLDKPAAALIIHQKLMSLSFTREKLVIPRGGRHFGILVLVGVPQVLSPCLDGQHQTGDGSQQADSAVHRQGQIQREAAHHLEPKHDVHVEKFCTDFNEVPLDAANVLISEPFSSQSPPTCSFNQNTGISAYLGHKGTNQGADFADPSTKPKPQGSDLCWKNLTGESRKHLYQLRCTKPRIKVKSPAEPLVCRCSRFPML